MDLNNPEYGSCHEASVSFQPTEKQLNSKRRRQRRNVDLAAAAVILVVPSGIFTAVCAVLTFSIHYHNPHISRLVSFLLFLLVALFGYLASSTPSKEADGINKPVRYGFLCATSLCAWVAGAVAGELNFNHNMALYYDVTNLNVYPAVDPATAHGQQMMDAGRLIFVPGAHLDLSKSIGFKNSEMYCVVPVTVGSEQNLSHYDFWAVGMNCCSGHANDFRCGEYNNPKAVAGLRLLQDGERVLYRLAVQQAEAAYKIQAAHPIFLHWVQDPIARVDAFQDKGRRFFLMAILTFSACQLFVVVNCHRNHREHGNQKRAGANGQDSGEAFQDLAHFRQVALENDRARSDEIDELRKKLDQERQEHREQINRFRYEFDDLVHGKIERLIELMEQIHRNEQKDDRQQRQLIVQLQQEMRRLKDHVAAISHRWSFLAHRVQNERRSAIAATAELDADHASPE